MTRSARSRRDLQEVLAVVEHQQELLRAQELDDARLERHPRTRSDAERGGDHLDGLGFVVRHAELAEPRAVAVVAEQARAAICSASRVLPTPPVPVIVTSGPVRTAPAISTTASSLSDEGRDLQREVSGNDIEPGGRFDVVRQPRPRQLEDPLGPSEVAQTGARPGRRTPDRGRACRGRAPRWRARRGSVLRSRRPSVVRRGSTAVP